MKYLASHSSGILQIGQVSSNLAQKVSSAPMLYIEFHLGTATFSGWGTNGRSGFSQFLKKVDVPIIPKAECILLWGIRITLVEGHLCAEEKEKDICSGRLAFLKCALPVLSRQLCN